MMCFASGSTRTPVTLVPESRARGPIKFFKNLRRRKSSRRLKGIVLSVMGLSRVGEPLNHFGALREIAEQKETYKEEHMSKRRLFVMMPVVGIMVLTAGLLLSAASSPMVVRMEDQCNPATFNAAVGPGTCVGDGTVTFDHFIA